MESGPGWQLLAIYFSQSLVNECVFNHNDIIFIVYVDDELFLGPSDYRLTAMMEGLKESGLNILKIKVIIGINIKKHRDGTYEFSQSSSCVVFEMRHLRSEPCHECQEFKFNYQSLVGKLNYMTQTSRADIILTIYKLSRFSAEPSKEHGLIIT